MKKYHIVIFLISAIMGLLSCNEPDNSRLVDEENLLSKSNIFELEKQSQVVLESDNVQFGRFRQHFIHSYDDEYWAFHDITKQQIFVFTSNGEFKTTIGSKGSGPAEFQNVYGYNFSEDNTIWAFDENLNSFKHFNLEDSLLSTVPGIYQDGFFQSHPQLFVDDKKLYIPITESEYRTQDFSQLWRSALVAVYDSDGKFLYTLGTFGDPVKKPDTYNVRAILDFDFEKEKMLASFSTSYKLGEYDLQNSTHQNFGVVSPNFMIPDEKTRVNDSFNQILEKGLRRSSPMAAFITDEHYIFHYQNLSQEWYDTRDPNTKDHYLVIYDRISKEYMGELQLPFALGNISKNGNIRLIESIDPDQFTISAYIITVNDD
jgi:hypothetical protein